MPANILLGKKLRNVRTVLSMTQPKFAEWLSVQTGEPIRSIKVCRMENFGARDACHPLRPSVAVTRTIQPFVLTKEPVASRLAKIKPKIANNALSQDSPTSATVSTESERASVMTKEQKKVLLELASLYGELGVLDAPGHTATEMINAVEKKIQSKAEKLTGDATDEREDIENRLKEIAEERAKINAERQQTRSELKQKHGISDQTLAQS